MFAALLPILGSLFGQVTKHFFPDPADELKRQELQNQLTIAIMQHADAIEKRG
jgi:hypothetical protein